MGAVCPTKMTQCYTTERRPRLRPVWSVHAALEHHSTVGEGNRCVPNHQLMLNYQPGFLHNFWKCSTSSTTFPAKHREQNSFQSPLGHFTAKQRAPIPSSRPRWSVYLLVFVIVGHSRVIAKVVPTSPISYSKPSNPKHKFLELCKPLFCCNGPHNLWQAATCNSNKYLATLSAEQSRATQTGSESCFGRCQEPQFGVDEGPSAAHVKHGPRCVEFFWLYLAIRQIS